MSRAVYIVCIAALLPALIIVLAQIVGVIVEEFREGHRSVGFAMIGMVIAIVAASMPWYLL